MTSSIVSSETGANDGLSRVQEIFQDFIAGSHFRRFFADVSAAPDINERPHEKLIREILSVVRNAPEDQREQCFKRIFQFCDTDTAPREAKQLARNVFIDAHTNGILSLKSVCEFLVGIENFNLTSTICQESLTFLRNKLNDLDYKGVRDLLKQILEKVQFVPAVINQHQRRQLEPIEDMVMEIIDRKQNHLPAYFVVTELYRVSQMSQKHRAFTVWKLGSKFSEIFQSFRPLAMLVSIIGRPFLIPIAGHCSLTMGNVSWRLEPVRYTLMLKGQLPYPQEYLAPQQFLLFQLLKQPRGRELINSYIFGRSDRQKPASTYDEVLSWILLEAMANYENVNDYDDFNYHWLHLTHLVVYAIITQSALLPNILYLLKKSLSVTPYRKARDLLMWSLLQYVSGAATKMTSEECTSVLELCLLLYTGEEEMAVDSSDLSSVKRMAPTCLWIILSKRLGPECHLKIPPSIATQIKFLEESLKNESGLRADDYILAVLCNAYSSNNEAFERYLMPILSQKWVAVDEFVPLPLGPEAPKRLKPFSLDFLDALTVHAKMVLLQFLRNPFIKMINPSTPGKPVLPSPSAVESFSRLTAIDYLDFGIKPLICQFIPAALAAANPNQPNPVGNYITVAQQLVHIYCEMLAYRIPMMVMPLQLKMNCFMQLSTALQIKNLTSHPQLYRMLEHLLLRQWLWLSSSDCLSVLTRCGLPIVDRQTYSDEMFKVILHCVSRSVKLVGIDLQSEVCQRLCSIGCLSQTAVNQFPTSLSSVYLQYQPNLVIQLQNERRILQEQLSEEYVQWRTLKDDTLVEHFARENAAPVFLCLIWQALCEQVSIPPVTYRIAEKLGPKLMTLNLQKMIDCILSRLTNTGNTDQLLQRTAEAINQMIWVHWLFPIEVFILTALMRPADDRESKVSLMLVNRLLQNSQEYKNRISDLVEQLPSQHWLCSDWYARLKSHYDQFEEKNYGKIYVELTGRQTTITVLPVYFSNVAFRMLPVADMIIHKLIENITFVGPLFETLVPLISTIYKFHPQPGTFLYTTLYHYDVILMEFPYIRRLLITKINEAVIEVGRPVNWLLSEEFRTAGSEWVVSLDYYRELIDKVIDGISLPKVPHWTEKDWRFGEFLNPASQALHSVCVELMACPFEPKYVCKALIRLVMEMCTITGPQNTRNAFVIPNAVATVLTALPPSYHEELYNELESFVANDQLLASSDPVASLSSFEVGCYSLNQTRHMHMLTLMHAFWQHASPGTFGNISQLLHERIAPLVTTEQQLIYVCRLVTPFLQRLYTDNTNKVLIIAVDLYEMLLRVDCLNGENELKLEDTLCDLLYHLKYMFVGDGVKQETDPIIAQLRPSIQAKLRFISHQPDRTQMVTDPASVRSNA